MHERKFAVLYCRISKNISQQDKSDNIVNQKILLQRIAAQYGFEHTQFFIDDGYSGTVFDCPALKQMEDAIWAGMVCAVLVKDISRLGRDYLKIVWLFYRASMKQLSNAPSGNTFSTSKAYIKRERTPGSNHCFPEFFAVETVGAIFTIILSLSF